ncbi:MAG TPA: hypothetical protein DGT23_31850 [Micromonosporaceae bacterium]|nr:hypothetical protein [Micromonosporaceae bacterium]
MKWLASIAFTAALVVTPQTSAAAACTWSASPLSVPSGVTTSYPTGHAGTGLIVGSGWVSNHWEGIIWRNGSPQKLPAPAAGPGSNYPRAVNANGVVAGYWTGNDGTTFGWRYTNGSYQRLPGRGTRPSVPTDINAAGDIVGFSNYFACCDPSHALLWKVSSPSVYTDFGVGFAEGIDDTGRVVVSWGVIFNANGSSTNLASPGSSFKVTDFSAGRIVGYSGTQSPYTIVEWNLSGNVVRQIPNGTPYEVNSSGSMTIARDGKKAVLRNGLAEFLTSPTPAQRILLGITNDHAVISDANSATQIWRCS